MDVGTEFVLNLLRVIVSTNHSLLASVTPSQKKAAAMVDAPKQTNRVKQNLVVSFETPSSKSQTQASIKLLHLKMHIRT